FVTRGIHSHAGTSAGQGAHMRWRSLSTTTAIWLLLGLYFIISFVLPLIVLAVQSNSGVTSSAAGAGVISHCCADGFSFLATDDRFWTAVVNTSLVATSAALIGTSVGVGIGLCTFGENDRISAA